MATPLFAQYGGPAVLSRGEAPAAMVGPDVNFRPFVEVSGIYSTGLSGVSVNSQGNVPNDSAAGITGIVGISGSHNWRHSSLGLSFIGGYNHYVGNSTYDSMDVSLLLGFRQQLSRHVSLTWNNTLAVFKRDPGFISTISPAVPFDPNQSYAPTTDFFNNRTIAGSSQLGLVIQRSTRLSLSFNGGFFETNRAAIGLYGVVGETATGDVQYRLTRRATIGANYNYSHYGFSHLISSSDLQGGAATFAYQLSRWWEFSGYGGFARVETKFIQSVPVDPAVAAIIGITQSSQIVYSVRYVPAYSGRISRTFHKGVLYISGGRSVTPGNGLFLTSDVEMVTGGYTYTGLRRWSFAANAAYQSAKSIGNVIGGYGGTTVYLNMSRQLIHSLHLVVGFSGRKYSSGTFAGYNQVVYTGSFGLGWTPGDVPLRIW
jgi:hypothetical protein